MSLLFHGGRSLAWKSRTAPRVSLSGLTSSFEVVVSKLPLALHSCTQLRSEIQPDTVTRDSDNCTPP